jgi:hypothetical protein
MFFLEKKKVIPAIKDWRQEETKQVEILEHLWRIYGQKNGKGVDEEKIRSLRRVLIKKNFGSIIRVFRLGRKSFYYFLCIKVLPNRTNQIDICCGICFKSAKETDLVCSKCSIHRHRDCCRKYGFNEECECIKGKCILCATNEPHAFMIRQDVNFLFLFFSKKNKLKNIPFFFV